MELNYFAILAASVVQFIIGAIWYTPVFGKMWGKIHGFDKVSKEEQKKMMKQMGPLLLAQFLVTIVTTVMLAMFINVLPSGWSVYCLAGFLWLGFVQPTQISAVLFGGTEPKWVTAKIAIMAGGALLCLEAAAAVLQYMA